MATERAPEPEKQIPYLDEFDPPITESYELPPITAEDIAHLAERLEAGCGSGEYTGIRTSDLYVLGHLSRHGRGQVQAVLRDPSLLRRLLTPTVNG